jgi:hypothetical protein
VHPLLHQGAEGEDALFDFIELFLQMNRHRLYPFSGSRLSSLCELSHTLGKIEHLPWISFFAFRETRNARKQFYPNRPVM